MSAESRRAYKAINAYATRAHATLVKTIVRCLLDYPDAPELFAIIYQSRDGRGAVRVAPGIPEAATEIVAMVPDGDARKPLIRNGLGVALNQPEGWPARRRVRIVVETPDKDFGIVSRILDVERAIRPGAS